MIVYLCERNWRMGESLALTLFFKHKCPERRAGACVLPLGTSIYPVVPAKAGTQFS